MARAVTKDSTKTDDSFTVTLPRFQALKNISLAQILVLLLLVETFFLGSLYTQVQEFKKNGNTGAQAVAVGTQPNEAAPSGPPQKVDVANGHLPMLGDENAKVTIVEFSDLECPFCAQFHKDTFAQLKKEYVDTGKVKFYYRHYPLPFHPKAVPLANAVECANDEGKFWEMNDKIFAENSAGSLEGATDTTYKQWAADIGLNAATFADCYDGKKHQALIDEDNTAGGKAGVSGTPTFYINGIQLVGAQPFASFKTIIDQELEKS